MPLEALWVSQNRTDSASDGIDGGTGCNFIFFLYSLTEIFFSDSLRLLGFRSRFLTHSCLLTDLILKIFTQVSAAQEMFSIRKIETYSFYQCLLIVTRNNQLIGIYIF